MRFVKINVNDAQKQVAGGKKIDIPQNCKMQAMQYYYYKARDGLELPEESDV